MKNDKDVKFIRVNGRVVPIRGKNEKDVNKKSNKSITRIRKNRAQKKKKTFQQLLKEKHLNSKAGIQQTPIGKQKVLGKQQGKKVHEQIW